MAFFLSIAGTLFLSLMTSQFKPIGQISAQIVTYGVWCLFIGCTILGVILAIINISEITRNNTNKRDKAVDEIVRQYIRLNNMDSNSQ